MAEQLGLFDGPPARAPLRVRESRRARRLTLRLLPPHTLELVVPRGTRPADVAAFVREHRPWIERARGELAAHYSADGAALPERVELAAVGLSWPVRYEHEPAARPICRGGADALLVRTRDAQRSGADELLRDWLIEQARFHLQPWLLREARAAGLKPKTVQIRLQRTRWGSCSSSGSISLNAGVMFLEPPLVRYLMIHELCHMVALNHSRRFWRAVERLEPDYRVLDRTLGESWSKIPLWAHDRPRGGEHAFDVP
jgi:predicted metal-dependent hydrolase